MLETHQPDAWTLFVLRHRKPANIYFHLVACLFFWLSIPAAFYFHRPWLIGGFFISGLIGTSGHYLFGDGTVNRKEATSSPQVVYFSTRMVLLFLLGRYSSHIQQAERVAHEQELGPKF